MSHKHNYTNYSKPQETPEVTPEVKTEETPVNVEPVTDPVAPTPDVEETKDDTVIGVVTECAKLNVRKEPSANAEVLTTIPLAAEVQVDLSESTEDFYKVCTGAGVEGYCVKEYININ